MTYRRSYLYDGVGNLVRETDRNSRVKYGLTTS